MSETAVSSAAAGPVARGEPRAAVSYTSDFADLLKTVREAGLLERRRGFYAGLFAVLLMALAVVAAAMVTLGQSWYQLLLAAALGLVLAQVGFLAHEAAHREIFASGRANDWAGRILGDLLVGMSYAYWQAGHNRHHANPNLVGRDPSVDKRAFSFTAEDAAHDHGLRAWYTRRQGWFLFPLLLLAGVDLHAQAFRTVLGRHPVPHRATEILLLTVRHTGYLGALCWLLPLRLACAFVAVQLAVFGVAIASSFVPNHVGMPMLPRGSKVDFLRRQVLTSRNIAGGPLVTAWMGGLNYQIEHHLFPSMPRPHLARARVIVRRHCQQHGIRYTESGLGQAYAAVVRYLNEVGHAAGRDPFHCPVSSSLGR